MAFIIKMLPGLIAALFAYLSLKVQTFIGFNSIQFEIMAFFLVYVLVAILAEKAMARYGKTPG